MKTIGYLRVSTDQQELNSQRLALLDYAYKHGIQIDKFIRSQASSRESKKERQLDQLFEELEEKDILIISELSRLGRSVGQIIQLVDELVQKQVNLIVVKENINLCGQQDMQTKVMITMFALFAEIERDLLSKRTREGMAAAQAKGVAVGRPKGSLKSRIDGKEEEIKEFLNKGVSKATIARIIGVSRSALRSFISSRKLE
jgi:DNA invertase Pin-like site-specific DNA recombinase